jgi:hypothetical protein
LKTISAGRYRLQRHNRICESVQAQVRYFRFIAHALAIKKSRKGYLCHNSLQFMIKNCPSHRAITLKNYRPIRFYYDSRDVPGMFYRCVFQQRQIIRREER